MLLTYPQAMSAINLFLFLPYTGAALLPPSKGPIPTALNVQGYYLMNNMFKGKPCQSLTSFKRHDLNLCLLQARKAPLIFECFSLIFQVIYAPRNLDRNLKS